MERWQITTPSHIILPIRAARALISAQNGTAALLYFHMQLNGGQLDSAAACSELALSAEQVKKTLNQLQKLDLAAPEGAATRALQQDKAPEYTPSDITDNLNDDNTFKQLVEDVSRKLGKVLSPHELKVLLGLYQWLGLPAEVISLLVVYCIDEQIRRFGHGKPPSMRSIEKTAVQWEKHGLLTAELAVGWLEDQEKRRDIAVQIARVLQISGRQPTASESKYINHWAELGFTPELIYLAYDRTVMRCGRLEWKYIDTILRSWYDKGLLTQEAVEQGDKPTKTMPATPHKLPNHAARKWSMNDILEKYNTEG
ncbi:MAG: DnaD domain protein [Oscillospiraceae bacterium]|nr:DnaD domain protein [Oscillospiraceae bacterium]